jgi:hypothetical protein
VDLKLEAYLRETLDRAVERKLDRRTLKNIDDRLTKEVILEYASLLDHHSSPSMIEINF